MRLGALLHTQVHKKHGAAQVYLLYMCIHVYMCMGKYVYKHIYIHTCMYIYMMQRSAEPQQVTVGIYLGRQNK